MSFLNINGNVNDFISDQFPYDENNILDFFDESNFVFIFIQQ